MRALITGGGTGGHINPALAIASIIKEHEPDSQFLFAGTPFGMEARLIPEAGYDFAPIKVSGFQRRISLENIKRNIQAVAYLATSSKRAKEIIRDFNPDIVFHLAAQPLVRLSYAEPIMTYKTNVIEPTIAMGSIITKKLNKKFCSDLATKPPQIN